MSIIKNPVVALALASLVGAQTTSVITVFFPDGEGQQLIGSIVTADASQTTLAVACAATVTDDASCGIDDVITLTVGPKTFHAQEAFDGITAVLDCEVDGTTAATCAQTYVGPESLLEEDPDILTATDATLTNTNTAITTIETTTTLEQSMIAFIPITLVDTLEGAAETGASGSGSGSTAANTGSSTRTGSSTASRTSGSTSGSSTASGAATPSGNSGNGASKADIRTLALTAVGAGLMGLTVFLL